MSLYSVGAEEVETKVPQPTKQEQEKITFHYPPNNFNDALKAQKWFFIERNGAAFRSPSFGIIPKMSFDDAFRLWSLYWLPAVNAAYGITPEHMIDTVTDIVSGSLKESKRTTASITVINNILFGDVIDTQLGFGHITTMPGGGLAQRNKAIKNFYKNRVDSKTRFLTDFYNEKFWKSLGLIAMDMVTSKFKSKGRFEFAIESILEAGEELPGRLKKVGDFAIEVTVDTTKKVAEGGAKIFGGAIGAFFAEMFSKFKTPIVIVGTGLLGYGTYKIIKSRSDRGKSLNPFSKSKK